MKPTSPDTFTPLYDGIIQQHGILTAAVYGLIWRYCQMSEGVCRASIDSMAERINVSRHTVVRHIEVLMAAGYLRDLTPNCRNRPHVYVINSVEICISKNTKLPEEIPSDDPTLISVGVSEFDSTVSEITTSGVSEFDSTVSEIDSRYINALQPGVSERVMNQTLLRDSFKKEKEETEKAERLWSQVYDLLAKEITRADLETWLNSARPLLWNGKTLEVAVANNTARLWLESHLRKTAINHLKGFTNAEVQIEFKLLPP